MGSKPKPPPPPTIVYAPAPPPPVVTQTPTQAVATQTALNEVSGKQTRLNMELGAQLDRTNADFFAGQDIRRGAAAAAEDRLTRQTQAGLDTALTRVRGQEERAGIVETGTQYREGLKTAGTETRATRRVEGEEQRAGIRETGTETRATRRVEGEETRATDLQREMFRRYKENRDFEQAQRQYRA